MSKLDVKQLMEGIRAQLAAEQGEEQLEGLSLDDLADAVAHPKAPAMIAEMMEAEASSVQEGDRAPDFSLPWLPGSGEGRGPAMTLSDHFGKRPVALILGSYT